MVNKALFKHIANFRLNTEEERERERERARERERERERESKYYDERSK